MRPIDADELIDSIKDDLYDRAGYWYRMIADALIKLIQSMPTIGSEPDQDHDDQYQRCDRCGTYVHRDSMYAGICAECQAEDAAQSERAGWHSIEEILHDVIGGDGDD